MYGDFDVRTSFIDAGGYLNNLQHIEWIDRLRA
jgi:acyl-CoA thioesterase FadM